MKMTRSFPLSTITLSLLGASLSAHSLDFSMGEIEGTVNSTLTVSNLWSTQKADKDFVYAGNGGTSIDPNFDNGRVNYDTGTFSTKLSGSHELSLRYKNYGAFVRGSYFYDTEVIDEDTRRTQLGNEAIDLVGKDAEIFDAFVYGHFDFGDTPLSARLGQQTINWGEAFFTPGGINVTNPFDLTKVRAPGSELKEALLPIGALWASTDISDELSLQAYYQYEWDETRLDPAGSFFGIDDTLTPGGNLSCLPGTITDTSISNGGTCISRTADDTPSDTGQYGLKLTWFAEELNGTEFSFYHTRYHSRLGAISGTTGEVPNIAIAPLPTTYNVTAESLALPDNTYTVDYAEDIKLFGLGFNTTTDLGFTLQGEIALHKDKPVQYSRDELLSASGYTVVDACLLDPTMMTPCGAAYVTVPLRSVNTSLSQGLALSAPGESVQGYARLDVWQATTTLVSEFHNVLGGSNGIFVFELAGTKVHNMPDDIGFAIYDASGSSDVADHVGWGYKMLIENEYVLDQVKVTPSFSFYHDVNGTLPSSVGPFIEESKQASLGVTVDYHDTVAVNLTYNTYWGAGTKNPFSDRDFVGLSVNYWY